LNILKIHNLSSKNAITLSWDSSVPGVSPGGDILGYQLIVRDPSTATQWIAFDGQVYGVPQ
jgi:hypothetical protein